MKMDIDSVFCDLCDIFKIEKATGRPTKMCDGFHFARRDFDTGKVPENDFGERIMREYESDPGSFDRFKRETSLEYFSLDGAASQYHAAKFYNRARNPVRDNPSSKHYTEYADDLAMSLNLVVRAIRDVKNARLIVPKGVVLTSDPRTPMVDYTDVLSRLFEFRRIIYTALECHEHYPGVWDLDQRLTSLQRLMGQAVKREDFKEAAEIRDEIAEINRFYNPLELVSKD